jgi:uncharacterized membrane protein YesL
MGTLLVFLIVFLPMGLLIWRMLRFTRDTVGTNSPLTVQRIYQTTFRSFFVRIDSLLVAVCLVMGLVMINAALFATFSGTGSVIARTMLLIVSLVILGLAAVILAVDFNHWPYARGVVITTFPEEHELEIQLPDATLRLSEGDIRKISLYRNNGKLQLGFAQFQLNDGDTFLLPFNTEGLGVIQEYFKGIPVEEHVRQIPLIRTGFKEGRLINENSIVENRRYGWISFVFIFLLGVCVVAMTYMMYMDAKWQDDMSMHAPVVCMKIKYGTTGAGTVKYPDKIYAEYLGKTYHFDMGRKYYRSLLGVDTIAVYFDEASGRAFLPTSGQVKHYTGLYLLVGGCGLLLMGGSIWEIVKIVRKGNPKISKQVGQVM